VRRWPAGGPAATRDAAAAVGGAAGALPPESALRLELGNRDSNPNFDVQSVACCHYTIPQCYAWLLGLVVEYRSGGAPCSRLAGAFAVRPRCEHTFVPVSRKAIFDLRRQGLSQRAIARELGIAPSTVEYHLGRPESEDAGPPTEHHPVAPASRLSTSRARVAELLDHGVSHAEIARRLSLSKATVSYHVRRLGRPVDERCARRYDWDAVQRYYDAGHSVRECIEVFGFSSASWFEAVKRGAVVARPTAIPIGELLTADTYRGRYSLKLRLLREGLKENRCERCGLAAWRDQPLTLALHHVNGRRDDNRLANLELLCPNCHSQTENFAGRNGRGMRAPT
jgi:DNA-binding CsgD family transcriptional regulator